MKRNIGGSHYSCKDISHTNKSWVNYSSVNQVIFPTTLFCDQSMKNYSAVTYIDDIDKLEGH